MALLRKRETPAEPEYAEEEAPAGGKGRPTPRRNEARAARPKSRYALNGATGGGSRGGTSSKEQRRAQAAEYRQAMLSGDVTKLPPRERAPERVLAREIVDTRRNMGPYFLIAAGIWIVGSFVRNTNVQAIITWIFLAGLLVVIFDSILLGRRIGRTVKAELGQFAGAGLRLYAVQRALLPARWRMPRPAARV